MHRRGPPDSRGRCRIDSGSHFQAHAPPYAETKDMAGIISSIAQALAGAQGVARAVASPIARTRDTKSTRPARGEDEVIVGAESIEAAGAIRSLTSNDQEDAREDHQQNESGEYNPQGSVRQVRRPTLDING